MSNVAMLGKRVPRVNLAELLESCGVITLEDGSEHEVRQVTGFVYHQLRQNENGADLATLYQAAHACAPTMSEEQCLNLSPNQISVILAMSSEQIERIAELAPNVRWTRELNRQPSSESTAAEFQATGSEVLS